MIKLFGVDNKFYFVLDDPLQGTAMTYRLPVFIVVGIDYFLFPIRFPMLNAVLYLFGIFFPARQTFQIFSSFQSLYFLLTMLLMRWSITFDDSTNIFWLVNAKFVT